MISESFNVFKVMVEAIQQNKLITSTSGRDKEFHFQDWVQSRLEEYSEQYEIHVDDSGRNTYPDFTLVEKTEGYEVKGLATPGRAANYDANSDVPSGEYKGRTIFYVFGRYPKDTADFKTADGWAYPVMDLMIVHGDFLNATRGYVHKNKHVDGFGSYGDIMIRDRKMYVVPTPFALTEGTIGTQTLIVPEELEPEDKDQFEVVGTLVRTEVENRVTGYSFNLDTNELTTSTGKNDSVNQTHVFKAYRVKGQPMNDVTLSV